MNNNNVSTKYFIIIVTYNGSKTIRECIDSLLYGTDQKEIILVDNASTDGTQDIVMSYPNIIFLPQEENLGFGQANNIGINYALENDADFVFLLNQDATVQSNTIEKLINLAKNESDFGILSPMQLNGDGTGIDHKFVKHINRGNPEFFSDIYLKKMKKIYELPSINAAAWLISSKCLKTVGGFDKLYFLYCEDDDYCYRARLWGFKIGLVPEAIIYHKRIKNVSESSKWVKLKLEVNREVVKIIINLIRDQNNFIQSVLYWWVGHVLRIVKCIFEGRLNDFKILILVKFDILTKLPRILKHKIDVHKIPTEFGKQI